MPRDCWKYQGHQWLKHQVQYHLLMSNKSLSRHEPTSVVSSQRWMSGIGPNPCCKPTGSRSFMQTGFSIEMCTTTNLALTFFYSLDSSSTEFQFLIFVVPDIPHSVTGIPDLPCLYLYHTMSVSVLSPSRHVPHPTIDSRLDGWYPTAAHVQVVQCDTKSGLVDHVSSGFTHVQHFCHGFLCSSHHLTH